MRFKKIGACVLLVTMLLSSVSFAGNTKKKKDILTQKEIQNVMVNTVAAIKASNLDRAFVLDKEHTYQFLKCLEFAIYQIKKNKNLTGNDIYYYMMGFVDKLYAPTGDCQLYYAMQYFFKKNIKIRKLCSSKEKIHVKTRAIILVALITLQKVLHKVARQNSI